MRNAANLVTERPASQASELRTLNAEVEALSHSVVAQREVRDRNAGDPTSDLYQMLSGVYEGLYGRLTDKRIERAMLQIEMMLGGRAQAAEQLEQIVIQIAGAVQARAAEANPAPPPDDPNMPVIDEVPFPPDGTQVASATTTHQTDENGAILPEIVGGDDEGSVN